MEKKEWKNSVFPDIPAFEIKKLITLKYKSRTSYNKLFNSVVTSYIKNLKLSDIKVWDKVITELIMEINPIGFSTTGHYRLNTTYKSNRLSYCENLIIK